MKKRGHPLALSLSKSSSSPKGRTAFRQAQRERVRARAHFGRERGWSAAEYLAVLLGLMVVWNGARAVLALVQEHHAEFSWALMIPF